MIKLIKFLFLLCITLFLGAILSSQFIYYSGYFEKNVSAPDNKAPVHFYAINLDRQPEKFAKLKNQTDHFGIELSRISAVDGYKITLIDRDTKKVFSGTDIKANSKIIERNHNYDVYCKGDTTITADFIYEAYKFKNFHHKPLSPGELGLICTSRLLWQEIARAPDQISVIFEDDVVLFPEFDQNLKKVIASLPKKWDLTYLDGDITYNPVNKRRPLSWSNIFRFPQIVLNDALAKIPTATDIFGTYGYMISTKSAKKLLELQTYKNAMPLDNLFSDVIKYRELIAYLSTKKIMTYDRSLPSDIEAMGRPK